MMRGSLFVCAFVLAGCSGAIGDTIPSGEGGNGGGSDDVLLQSNGMTIDGKTYSFGDNRAEMHSKLSALVNDDFNEETSEYCGMDGDTAPRTFTTVDYNRVQVTYENDAFVGWSAAEEKSPGFTVADSVEVGDARSAVEQLEGFELVPDSTFGIEFKTGAGIRGFFEDGQVFEVFAGSKCLFEITSF